MLSPNEISDVKRHLGYPAAAINRGSPEEFRNYQFNAASETLACRLQELIVSDEARLTGACCGAVNLVALDPAVGNTVSVIITATELGSPVTLLATAVSGDKKLNLAAKLTSLAAQHAGLSAAGFVPGGPYTGESVFNPNSNPVFELKAPNPFTLAVSFSGQTAAVVTQQGTHVDPQALVATDINGNTIKWGYIPICNYLENAIGGVTRNADVARAGEYVRGPELKERKSLLQHWRKEMASFLGLTVQYSGNSWWG